MGNCMCKSSKGGTLVEKRNASPYSPPAPPPSQVQSQEQSREQSQEEIMQSSDAAPRIATPIPHVSAFDDEIVTVGDVRYIPPDVTHGPLGESSSVAVDAIEVEMKDGTLRTSEFWA